MFRATCIKKIICSNTNKVLGYTLIDLDNPVKEVTFSIDSIKDYIEKKIIDIDNLKLENNKIIETSILKTEIRLTNIEQDKEASQELLKEYSKMQKFINKAIMLGLNIRELDSITGNNSYIITTPTTVYLYINPYAKILGYQRELIVEEDKDVIVLGGYNLEEMTSLFNQSKFKDIHFNQMKAPNLKSVKNLFEFAVVNSIDFIGLDLSKIDNISGLYSYLKSTGKIDLRGLNPSEFKSSMFTSSAFNIIDIRGVNITTKQFDSAFGHVEINKIITDSKEIIEYWNKEKTAYWFREIKEVVYKENI